MAIDTNKVQQQAAELSNQIWSICNDLRGGMDANEFRNYILGTIFYRYLSERTEMYMQDLLKEDNISYTAEIHTVANGVFNSCHCSNQFLKTGNSSFGVIMNL